VFSSQSFLRKHVFKILRGVLTVLLLGWILSRVGFGKVFHQLRGAKLGLIGLSMLVFQIGVITRGLRWWILLRGSAINTSLGYILGLTYVGEFFSGALPLGYAGDVVRALEFRGQSSGPLSAGIVLLDRMLGLMTLMTVALVALGLGHSLLPQTTALVLAAISLSGIAAAGIILHGDLPRRLGNFLPKSLSLAGDGIVSRFYEALTGCAPASMRLALLLSLLNTFLTVSNQYLVALAVGITLNMGPFFIITPIVNLSLLLPTFGGLGFREAGYQILLSQLSVPGQVAVALGIGVFVSRLSAPLLGGIYYLLWNTRR
jgi:uncharacterized membrane protein YbhN (UPF0104 family)